MGYFSKLLHADVDEIAQLVGPVPLAVYVMLLRHADENGTCFPHIATLAGKMNTSEPTIKRALKTLKDEGLISVQRTQHGNSYTLLSRTKNTVPLDHIDLSQKSPQINMISPLDHIDTCPQINMISPSIKRDPYEEDIFKKTNQPTPTPSTEVPNEQVGSAGRQAVGINAFSDTPMPAGSDWRECAEAALVAAGVKAGNARSLAHRPDLTEQSIRDQIDALPFRSGDNPSALLVISIREGWSLPEPLLRMRSAQAAEARNVREKLAAEAERLERQARPRKPPPTDAEIETRRQELEARELDKRAAMTSMIRQTRQQIGIRATAEKEETNVLSSTQ